MTHPHNNQISAEIDYIMQDYAASYWLKDALKAALLRDAVDSANDAELLADILKRRAARSE
jgi:hypothetical protein